MEQKESLTTAHSIGTGFLLLSTNRHVVLITAKHVVLNEDGSIKQNLAYRLNEKNTASDLVSDSGITNIVGNWFLSTNADLACRIIAFGNESDFATIPLDHLLPKMYVHAATPVLVLGFPMGLRSEKYATPIARHGIVASAADEDITLDAFVFPGNSGGPAIYSPVIKVGANLNSPLINDERIIGVVVDYIPYVDVAVSPQTKRPRITFEENSGLSHVVPSDKILELLNYADFRKLDEQLAK